MSDTNQTQSASIIDLLSEGPINGIVGRESGVYLGGTPIVDTEDVEVYGSVVGTIDGSGTQVDFSPRSGFDLTELELGLGDRYLLSTETQSATVTIGDERTRILQNTIGYTWSADDIGTQVRISGSGEDSDEVFTIVEVHSSTKAIINRPSNGPFNQSRTVYITETRKITSVVDSNTLNIESAFSSSASDSYGIIMPIGDYRTRSGAGLPASNFENVQVSFVNGQINQPSFSKQVFGAGTTSFATNFNEEIKQTTRTGGIYEVQGQNTINKTATGDMGISVPENIDTVKIVLQFPSLISYSKAAAEYNAGVEFQIYFQYKRGAVWYNHDGSLATASPDLHPPIFGFSDEEIDTRDPAPNSDEWDGGLEDRIVGRYGLAVGAPGPTGSNRKSGIVRAASKSEFVKEFRIEDITKYKPFTDFRIRIKRVTEVNVAARNDSQNQSQSYLQAIYCYSNDILNYAGSAVVGLNIGSTEFDSIPDRSYLTEGMKIQVPTNYLTPFETGGLTGKYTRNKTTGADTGTEQTWDGKLRGDITDSSWSTDVSNVNYGKVYSNNPAWVYYDIMVNNRYGLGDFVTGQDINKYDLYRIARYCDELVPDGKGGQEPRFTCNIYIKSRVEAYKLINDLASVFRSIVKWDNGVISASQDAPKGPIYTFSNSNIIGGSFSYESTSKRQRINQVGVTWNNPNNFYKQDVVLIDDPEAIIEDGRFIKKDTVAVGCTSEGQATRLGKWMLLTERLETELVKFNTGINGAYLRPGDIFYVQDFSRTNAAASGRLAKSSQHTTTTVYFDRSIPLEEDDYELHLVFPNAAAYLQQDKATINGTVYSKGDLVPEAYVGGSLVDIDSEDRASNALDAASGDFVQLYWSKDISVESKPFTSGSVQNVNSITVSSAFSSVPNSEVMFTLTNVTDVNTAKGARKYRVLNTLENDDKSISVSGHIYLEDKFAAIDRGYLVQEPNFTPLPSFDNLKVPSPTNPTISITRVTDSSSENQNDGTYQYKAVVSWGFPKVGNTTENYPYLDFFEVRHPFNPDNTYRTASVGTSTTTEFVNYVNNVSTEVLIRSVNSRGRRSPWASAYIELEDQELPKSYNEPVRISGITTGGNIATTIELDPVTGDISWDDDSFSVLSPLNGTVYQLTSVPDETMPSPELDAGESAYLIFDADVEEFKLIEIEVDSVAEDPSSGVSPPLNFQYLQEVSSSTPFVLETTLSQDIAIQNSGRAEFRNEIFLGSNNFSSGNIIKIGDGADAWYGTVQYVTTSSIYTKQYINKAFTAGDNVYSLSFKEDLNNDFIVARLFRVNTSPFLYDLDVYASLRGIRGISSNSVTLTADKYFAEYDSSSTLINGSPANNITLTATPSGAIGSPTYYKFIEIDGGVETVKVDFPNNTSGIYTIPEADLPAVNSSIEYKVEVTDDGVGYVVDAFDTVGLYGLKEGDVGPDGLPGLPGATQILSYNTHVDTAAVANAGEYQLSTDALNDDDTGSLGSTWSIATAPYGDSGGYINTIFIHESDQNSADQSIKLNQLEEDDFITWYESDTRWIDYRITGSYSKSGDVYGFPVEYIEHNDNNGANNSNITSGSANNIKIRLSRALESIIGILTNPSHVEATDQDGILLNSLADAGGTFKVVRGVEEVNSVSPGPVFSVSSSAVSNGLTMAIDSSTGVYTLSQTNDSWIGTREIFELQATYLDVTITQTYTIAKSIAGVSARVVKLVGEDTTIVYNGEGEDPQYNSATPGTIVFTATEQGYDSPEFRFKEGSGSFGSWGANTYDYSVPTTLSGTPFDTTPVTLEVEAREGSSGTDIATDKVSIISVYNSSGVLTLTYNNSSHVIPTDNDFTNAAFGGSGGTIEIFQGSNLLTYNTTAASYPTTDGQYNLSISRDTGDASVSAGSFDGTAGTSVTLADFTSSQNPDRLNELTVFTLSAYIHTLFGKDLLLTKKISLAPSRTGQEGVTPDDARVIQLIAEDNSIAYDSQGANPSYSTATSNGEILLTTEDQGYTSPQYQFTVDGIAGGWSGTDSYGYTVPTTLSGTPFDTSATVIKVEVREGVDNNTIASDQTSIVKVVAGTRTITVSADNTAHVVRADANGNNPVLSGSGITFEVFEGATQLDYDAGATPANGTYKITIVETNVTADTTPTTSNKARIYGDITAFTADSGNIVFTVTIKDTEGNTTTRTVQQSFSKSLEGVAGSSGFDAQAVKLTADRYSVVYNSAGNAIDGSNIALTAEAINFENSPQVEFRFYKDGDTPPAFSPTATASLSIPASNSTETYIVDAGSGGLPVEASDSITVVALQEGGDAITISYDNDSHVVPTNNDYTGGDFTGSGGSLRIFQGATPLTFAGIGTGFPTNNSRYNLDINRTSGDSNVNAGTLTGTGSTTATVPNFSSGSTINTATVFTITAKIKNDVGSTTTLTQKISLSPSNTGSDGDTGASVNIVFVRSSTVPATPDDSSGVPTSPITWYDNPPANDGNLLYASRGTKAVGSSVFDWSTPYQVDGELAAEIYIYSNVTTGSAPNVPSASPPGGVSTYNFDTNTLTINDTNWNKNPPSLASNGDKVYVSVGLATGAVGKTDAPVTYGAAALYAQRKDGKPGIPGASVIQNYDWARTGTQTVTGNGQYKFSNSSNPNSGGTSSWANITSGTYVTHIHLSDDDRTGVNQDEYLTQVQSGDTMTWFFSTDKWAEFIITGSSTDNGGSWTFPVDLVEYDETAGTGFGAGDGVNVDWRFSRAPAGIPSFVNHFSHTGVPGKRYADAYNTVAADYYDGNGIQGVTANNVAVGDQTFYHQTTSNSGAGTYDYGAFTPIDTTRNLLLPKNRRWLLGAYVRHTRAGSLQLYFNYDNPSNPGTTAYVGFPNFEPSTTDSTEWIWGELDATGAASSVGEFALSYKLERSTATRFVYIDGLTLIDVTDFPQYTASYPPPIQYIEPSMEGPDGDPGDPGEDAYTVVANPEFYSFLADSTGNVSSTSGFSLTFDVKKGSTAYSYQGSGSAGTYRYGTIVPTNVVANNNSGTITVTTGGNLMSGTTTTTGSIQVPIIDNETSTTIATKTIGLSKSIAAARDGATYTFRRADTSITDIQAGDWAGVLTTSAARAVAAEVISVSTDGFIRPNDRITVYDDLVSPPVAGTRIYIGSATTSSSSQGTGDYSSLVVDVVDGSLIVEGTLSADTLAANSTITNTLNIGSVLDLASGGTIKTTGTTYGTGTGVFLGENSGVQKFRAGIPGGKRIEWDGSTATISGTLVIDGTTTLTENNTLNTNTTKSDVGLDQVDNDSTSTIRAVGAATSGTVGGWTITGSAIYTGALDTNGYTANNNLTISTTGGIHTPSFYTNPDGTAGFKGTLTIGGTDLTTGNTLNENTTKADVGLSQVDNNSTSTIRAVGAATSGTVGGWTINSTAIYTGALDTNGYTANNNLTISTTGGIHTPSFYTNPDGTAGFKGTLTIGDTDLTENNTLNNDDAEALAFNGTFTEFTSGLPTGWTAPTSSNRAGWSQNTNSTYVLSGGSSLKGVNSNSGTRYLTRSHDSADDSGNQTDPSISMRFSPDTEITFSCDVYLIGGYSGARPYIYFDLCTALGTSVSYFRTTVQAINQTNRWQKLRGKVSQKEFNSSSGSPTVGAIIQSVRGIVIMPSTFNGTVYYDNFKWHVSKGGTDNGTTINSDGNIDGGISMLSGGSIEAGADANNKILIDGTNKLITITDSGTVRVKLGDLS